MEATDLRTEFTKETKTRFNTEWLAYNDYVTWLEQRLVKLLTIPPVINCGTCKYQKVSQYVKPCYGCKDYSHHQIKGGIVL
jgi:hypothetical protein